MKIETNRLVLRRWFEADDSPFAEICGDPDVMSWIGNGSTKTKEECSKIVKMFEREWEENGFGLFAVEHKKSKDMIGFVGLSIPTFLPEVLPSVEIGWRLSKKYWGRGLATEGAMASMKFGFEQKKLKRIISIYQHGNDASVRIMKKLGMNFERETTDPSCQRKVSVYERKYE